MEGRPGAGECFGGIGIDVDARVKDFQRNTAFVSFIFVLCFAAFLFLTQSLRGLLVPLVWSAFFAVPLTALISDINKVVVRLITLLLRPFRCTAEHPIYHSPLPFKAYSGKNVLVVE